MNILKMDLKGKQKVPKAEVLRNANNEKVGHAMSKLCSAIFVWPYFGLKRNLVEYVCYLFKLMNQNLHWSQVKQLKKSLIPTLASRWQVSVPSSKRDGLLQYLENKVGLLEGELKRKNEEGDKALRLLERNFIDVKVGHLMNDY